MANDNAELVKALASAIREAIVETRPAEKIDIGEYLMRPENREPDLDRPVFQNGQPIQIKGASQDTIKHLNALVPGDYLGGAIKVTFKGQAPDVSVHITYPCSTVDDRMKIYSLVSSFSDMICKISKEQRDSAKQ